MVKLNSSKKKPAGQDSGLGRSGRKLRRQNLWNSFFSLMILVLIWIISEMLFFRIDLTAEKRFTLAPTTRELLSTMDDVVYFKVFLDGKDLPPGFRRLRNATQELLDEFRAISGENVQYEFINPLESSDSRTRNEIGKELTRKGLMPTNIELQDKKGKASSLVLFTSALVSFNGREIGVELLKNNLGASAEENLNSSIEALEYEFLSAIRKLQIVKRPRVAFIEGHGELTEMDVADFSRAITEYYEPQRIRLNGALNSLLGFDAAIVAGPDSLFSDQDKYILDQFIMEGGKVLWLVDGTLVNMDSLSHSSETMGLVNDVNLTDMLFTYGVRVNPNLVMDIQSAVIPVNVANLGAQPQFKPFPWFYFPLLSPSQHPIARNLNLVKGEFASSLDSVGNNQITTEVLLSTSRYTKLVQAPVRVSLEIINREPVESQFAKSNVPVAMLLEGRFRSVYKNRLSPEFTQNPEVRYLTESKPNKMIVVGDGDLIRNQLRLSTSKESYYPLGFDRYTGQTYGNKDFALNCLNYLLEDNSLLSVRNREIHIRPLDKEKMNKSGLFWKLLNTLLPILFVIVVGIGLNLWRKRKYTLGK